MYIFTTVIVSHLSLFVGLGNARAFPAPKPIDPDCYRRAIELITSKGYPAEEHNVTTSDGYILGLQRIPYGRGQKPGQRESVLIQHGLEGSSANFLENYAPTQNLALFLADAGFDVWLANSRGNSYSLGHVKYTTADKDYWLFSWDEMAKYDLPAMIDDIIEKTGNAQIYYVGHSQGTLIGFAEFSQNPETAKKIKKFFAIAPVAHVGHINSPLKIVAPLVGFMNDIDQWLGINEFKPSKGLKDEMTKFACAQDGDKWKDLCQNIELLIYGHNATLWNTTRVPVYLCHDPDTTSARDVVHFGQMINTNKMQMYDYGAVDNLFHYSRESPPVYDLSKMTVPTILFTGGQDKLADPEDVHWLEGLLDDTTTLEATYNIPEYGHLDFIFSLDAPKKVFAPIASHMEHEN